MLLTVNRDSAAIINVNISDPSYQKKKSLKEVVTATVNTKSTHQCEFCRTIVSNNWNLSANLTVTKLTSLFLVLKLQTRQECVTFTNRNCCLRSTRTHLDPILWEITDVWSLVLTVSHAVVQMWCPTGSLRLSSRLPHNVTLSVWLLLSPPRVSGFVRVPGSPLTSSLRPPQHLCAICGQKRAL